jgi:Ca2+-binding EF-hand superfamily protein
MKKILLLAVTSFAMISFAAIAQNQTVESKIDRQAKMQQRFQALDSNRDGKLSYQEVQNNPEHRARFDASDLNRDGALTINEIQQAHAAKKQQHQQRGSEMREKMTRLDVNQDQALSRAEIGNEMPKLLENFDIFDGNSDGKITREELRIAGKAMRADRQSQAK